MSAFLFLVLLTALPVAGEESPAIKVDINLVLVNAAVTDGAGQPVTGLERADFQIWEDKVRQEIRYFSTEETPVSVGIVFDVSGSMSDKLSVSKDAISRFLQTGTPQDEYALISFDNRPRVTQKFTTDTAEFQRQLTHVSASGYTALYDAVYLGLETLRQAHNRRKALLILTDGEDNRSHYNFKDVRELAKEADVQLFAIGIPGIRVMKLGSSMIDARKGTRAPGQDVLQELVDLAGGQLFMTRDAGKLANICATISKSLRTEYVIGYAPLNANRDGKWRKLRLKVSEASHVNVHARSGYYAPMQ